MLHKQNHHLLGRNSVADILMHEAQNLNVCMYLKLYLKLGDSIVEYLFAGLGLKQGNKNKHI